MILLRRLAAEAERCTRGDVLVRRWQQILWSKGVEGVVLETPRRQWHAGSLASEPEALGPALKLHGAPRLDETERMTLGILAATLAGGFERTERLAAQTRKANRKQIQNRAKDLTGDLTRLLGQLERHVDQPTDERFDARVAAVLRRALRLTRGKIYGPDGAAALLDLRPTTLQSKLKKYGVKARSDESA